MKMEEIRVLNMDLNDNWHFFKFLGIRKLIPRLRKWKMNLQNGTRVPGGAFAGCENFCKLNSGLANLSFEDFASWPPFSQVEILLCFSGFFSFFGSLRLSSNSFKVPPNFDHPKSLS